ncbi:MAG: phosphopantetheine-binding protein [Acidobacteriota bacterium]
MTKDELKGIVLRILGEIAPEADLSRINPSENLRDQLDIDSMDFLNFVIALNKELKIEIPETDYPKFATLDSSVEHIILSFSK